MKRPYVAASGPRSLPRFDLGGRALWYRSIVPAPLALLALVAAGPLDLDWRAPAGCPDAAAVIADIERLIDLEAASAPVRVRARTRRIGDRYALDLSIRADRLGLRRRLVTDQCDTLAEATALLVAIVVDPQALAGGGPEAPVEPRARELDPALPLAIAADEAAPQRAPPRAPPNPPSTPQDEAAPETSTSPIVALVRVEGGIDVGATPGPAGSFGGGFGLIRRRLRAELHGIYTPPRRLTLGADEVGRISRWAIGARICALALQGRFEAVLCGGLEGGQLSASGTGVTVMRQEARPPWLAVLGGLGLLWSPIPRLAVGARVEAVVPPVRAQFAVDGVLVHAVDPVGLRASAGIELRFGPVIARSP